MNDPATKEERTLNIMLKEKEKCDRHFNYFTARNAKVQEFKLCQVQLGITLARAHFLKGKSAHVMPS